MLKEYLVVAQEALKAKKEIYLVKQQRLELAQQEMLLFNELSEDNRSITSCKTPQHAAEFHKNTHKGTRKRERQKKKNFKSFGTEPHRKNKSFIL